MRVGIHVLLLFGLMLTGVSESLAEPGAQVMGAQTFYRMLARQSNGALPYKTQVVLSEHGATGTGATGMAENFTEFPFLKGVISATYRENGAFYPRIATGIDIRQRRVNVFDIVMDWPYEPDGVVWGQGYREFGQTYVATGDELVSISLMVASPPDTFLVTLHEGGPEGKQIGREHSFTSGSSGEYGIARWLPGEAPTISGKTYYIHMRSKEGKGWNPYLHSTGDVYANGMAWFDGRPEPESDLALWITEQQADLTRALLVTPTDEAGWVADATRVRIRPRSQNLRMIQADVVGPNAFCNQFECRIWSTDDPPRLIYGPVTHLACGRAGEPYAGNFLFGPADVPINPNEEVWIEILYFAGGDHGSEVEKAFGPVKRIKLTAYGEKSPRTVPVLYNQTAAFSKPDEVEITWDRSFPSPVEVEFWQPGSSEHEITTVDATLATFTRGKLAAGSIYWFRLTPIGPGGEKWLSPVYQIQTPGASIPAFTRYPEDPPAFLRLAPVNLCESSQFKPSSEGTLVSIKNSSFENGLEGWTLSGKTAGSAFKPEEKITPQEGTSVAGWSLVAGATREQVFAENEIYQTIDTKPGEEYELSLAVFTEAVGGHRGETRVRLLANSKGEAAFEGPNSSQWYWTDGRWMRFARRWVAESDKAVIGASFFRWRDMDRAVALIDDVQVRHIVKKTD